MPILPNRHNLRIEQTETGVIAHVVGCGALNEQSTPDVEQQLIGLATELGGVHLVVDLAAVHYMSSIGLGMLIGLRQRLRTACGQLSTRAVPEELYDIFNAT